MSNRSMVDRYQRSVSFETDLVVECSFFVFGIAA